MTFKLQSPLDLPPNLLEEYSIVEKTFIEVIQSMNPASLEASFNEWKSLFDKVLQNQAAGIRFHKGGELQNMGACKLYTGQTLEAFHYFILAYVEDLLSLDLDSANITPSARTLKEIFKLSDKELILIQDNIEIIINSKGIVQNPYDVLNLILQTRAYDDLEKKARKLSLSIEYNKYPSISHMPGEFENRVFIGGDYESVYLLDAIIIPVLEFGFTPIIAAEFKTDKHNIHHHALLLLHNCKYAIFDVSSKGGQMMEAERTLDYETETLFVCNKSGQSRVSAMLKSFGKNYEIQWFEDRKELKSIIYHFLPVQASPSEGIK